MQLLLYLLRYVKEGVTSEPQGFVILFRSLHNQKSLVGTTLHWFLCDRHC